MGTKQILERLREALQPGEDYLVPADHLPARDRASAEEIRETLRNGGAAAARETIERLHAEGDLSILGRVSALHVVAASPRVRDLAEAARLADLQEYLALEHAGEHLLAWLASADRHRGVVAFLMGRPQIALEWFSRAFERERTPENLGNVLASLLAAGERRAATELLDTVEDRFAEAFARALRSRIELDDDLRELRAG